MRNSWPARLRSLIDREGPRGLVMRVHMGPHYVAQFVEDRIMDLPLVVEQQSWGGYRIDLVPEPWGADLPTLLGAWRQGMAHLQGAKVFAEPHIKGGRLTRRPWTRAEHCEMGGVVTG